MAALKRARSAPVKREGSSMATYAVTCANCIHQRSFPTQQLADTNAPAHSRANPTHTVKVHRESER